jgi:sentrin-specific protease 1
VPLEVITIEEDKEVRKQQDEEVRGGVVVRRGPIYKELYKASQQKRDAKLKTLEFEVRLAEEGRLGLERLAEALPRITPKKEVWLSWILLFIFHIVL